MIDQDKVHRPRIDTIDEAREEYRRTYRRHETWLAIAMAVAGGMLGGALVLQMEIWRTWMS